MTTQRRASAKSAKPGKPDADTTQAASPILNGPYTEPQFHYATAEDGSLNYDDRCTGRRVFSPQTPQVPLGQQPQANMYDINDFAAQYRQELINRVSPIVLR